MSPHPTVALVTGCSTGIGRATALQLAASGRTVYATARDLASIEDLQSRGCRILRLDVTDEGSMAAAVDRAIGEAGAVDVLVNNAGYSQSGALETVTMRQVRAQFDTNVFGMLRMCQLVLPAMRARGGGRIVNISSMGANFTFPGGGAYHATKYAVEAVSDALRFEVAGFGVGVTVVQPGLIRSEFAATAGSSVESVTRTAVGGTEEVYARFNADVARSTRNVYERGALARLGGTPDDVARAIVREVDRRRARSRVRVTASARVMITLRHLMSDRMWDRFLRTQFSQPSVSPS